MTLLTGLALRRRSVTMLIILLVLVGGIVTYQRFERELFPEIEFPNIIIVTYYAFANPDAVVRDVTEPIEDAIDGVSSLKEFQSVSTENTSMITATFEFGEDMVEAERNIISNINALQFPDGVTEPYVSRIASDTFPVLQLSVLGDRDIPSLQRILDDLIVPRIEAVDGVAYVTVLGWSEEQVFVTVDVDKVQDVGLSLSAVAGAIQANNLSSPAGNIDDGSRNIPVRIDHELGSLDEIKDLVVGFESISSNRQGQRPIRLSDIAVVELDTEKANRISRANGSPSLGVIVLKDPDANTLDVTEGVLAGLDDLEGLPPDVEIFVLTNDGPEIRAQLGALLREGFWGLVFAVATVFAFLLNLRPTILRGVTLALRPTLIIGISIPLSIITGILLMGFIGLPLNFMTLAGLAIAVGRVVDDSIVVLENMYRHIQAGEDRMQAALDGTREVGAAIVASTLTTVVIFVPLAFIQGLVGSFFSPFAIAVSFALIASTFVALTAVPLLGSVLLKPGDLPDDGAVGGSQGGVDTLIQRLYIPVLLWSLGHKLATVLIAALIVAASLSLLLVIPITLFPAGAPQYLTIDVELPTGTSIAPTYKAVLQVEGILTDLRDQGHVKNYQVVIGAESDQFGNATVGSGLNTAGFIVALADDVPLDIADTIRERLTGNDEATFTVKEIENGPPTDELEITITGSNFADISSVAKEMEAEFEDLEGIINLTSDLSEARQEVVIDVDAEAATESGLSAAAVAMQVNRFLVGQVVTEVKFADLSMDVVIRGRTEDVDDINKLKALDIESPFETVKLGAISTISLQEGPVSISRYDGERSATVSAGIVARDTQGVGRAVGAKIAALDVPPSVKIKTGGIFQQIAEGFQDVFTAMAVGIVLVYLVMVATLGSLRNPLVVVLCLPLAAVGALVALVVTGRTLSLSALMGTLLLIGVVVTNAIVLIVFVEQLRERGLSVYDALVEGSRVRMRPILMTAFTTTFALLPLAAFPSNENGIIGEELATVVIGGLISSTFLTLVVVPVVYTIVHVNIPNLLEWIGSILQRALPSSLRAS